MGRGKVEGNGPVGHKAGEVECCRVRADAGEAMATPAQSGLVLVRLAGCGVHVAADDESPQEISDFYGSWQVKHSPDKVLGNP